MSILEHRKQDSPTSAKDSAALLLVVGFRLQRQRASHSHSPMIKPDDLLYLRRFHMGLEITRQYTFAEAEACGTVAQAR
jgi:hypothetical protein